MTGSPPLVSVIVPVYNVRDFLPRCIDSLLATTGPQKEILLVDDGSTDGSGTLCDSYARSAPEITVIHHDKNKGVSYARETGFSKARGQYVLFVDGDDYVHPQLLARTVEAAQTHGADLVCSQIWHIYPDRRQIKTTSIFGVYGKEEIQQLARTRLLYDFSFNNSGMPLFLHGKLFRKDKMTSCIRSGLGLTFGEDTLTVMTYLLTQTDTLVCLDDPLYYYCRHSSQMTASHPSRIWPLLIPYYERMDALGGSVFFHQLVPRIWNRVKPTVYDKRTNWGGFISDNRFVRMNRMLRNTPVLKKYLWDNPDIPAFIRRKPHFFLMKHRLYWADYLLYCLIWRLFR